MFDKSLKQEWANAAIDFLKTDRRRYGAPLSEEAFINFIEKRIEPLFHQAVDRHSLLNNEDVIDKIEGKLDRIMTEEESSKTSDKLSATQKIVEGLKTSLVMGF